MVSLEIMFLGTNLLFIAGYIFLNLELGLVYALVNLSLAAAEAAIGFGLLMASFRNRPAVAFSEFNRLKGLFSAFAFFGVKTAFCVLQRSIVLGAF